MRRAARTTRRTFVTTTTAATATGAVALPLLVAACAPGGPSPAGSQGAGGAKQPVKIAYWGMWGGSSTEPETAVVANFQEKFSHITVEALQDSQIAGSGALDREKFTAALAAGTPPEVIKIDRFKMGGYGAKAVTTILDDLIKRDKIDIKKFYDATIQEVLYPPAPGGKITALPWNTDDRALYYNKQHFIEAGLDPNKPPKTWDDALDMGLRLTKRDGGTVIRAGFNPDGAGTNWNIGYHWSAGGRWLKEGSNGKPNRKAAFNDDVSRRWMQFVKDTQDRIFGSYDAQVTWQGRFGSNEKGVWWNDGMSMGITGVWELGNFKKWGPNVDFGIAPPPRPKGMEGTTTTWAGGFALAIPTTIKGNQLEAAWEFLKYYCYGKDAQILFGSRTGQMPALMEAAEDKGYKESDPHMPVFVDIMKNAKIRDVTPAGDEIWFNDSANSRPYAIFNLIRLVREGKQSLSDILNEAEKYVNQTLDEAWARAGA